MCEPISIGIAIGAGLGAGMSAMNGGSGTDILKGALIGGVLGGVTGGAALAFAPAAPIAIAGAPALGGVGGLGFTAGGLGGLGVSNMGLMMAGTTLVGGLSQVTGSLAQNRAAEQKYMADLQAQQANTLMARQSNDEAQRVLMRQRAQAERTFAGNIFANTLKAAQAQGKAIAHMGSSTGVASAVFDHLGTSIYKQEQRNVSSNIWNLQANAQDIQAKSLASYRKKVNRQWQSRSGAPPIDTLAVDSMMAFADTGNKLYTLKASGALRA
jgi:hypothetical protein